MSEPSPTRRHRAAQAHLADQIARIDFALPGSVVERHMRCGNPTCRCKADPPQMHGPYLQWTRKVGNKTVTKLLSAEQRQRYQPWFDNARKLRELFGDLEALSVRAATDAEGW